jgi:ABC-type molybdate transport system substrate-binding protein
VALKSSSFRIPGPVSYAVLIVISIWFLYPFAVSLTKGSINVKSCGGNFDFLNAFNKRFTAETGIHVDYSAAPIQFLLGRILSGQDKSTDILVGRAGPGWQVLKEKGFLDGDPGYFAVDPLVIITPEGNPENILNLQDLGRKGVRIGRSNPAMRPKGMCPTHFLEVISSGPFPGLVNGWERNIVLEDVCGRLLPGAVARGEVDAVLTARTMAFLPPLKDNCSFIDLPPKLFVPMKKCRSSIPQMVGKLNVKLNGKLNGKNSKINSESNSETSNEKNSPAQLYINHLLGESGNKTASEFGYIHLLNPSFKGYSEILRPAVIPEMAPRMVAMSRALMEAGAYRAAATFFAKTHALFGPSRQDGPALLGMSEALCRLNKKSNALRILQYAKTLFPVDGRKEWLDTIPAMEKGLENPTEKWLSTINQKIRRLQSELSESPDTATETGASPSINDFINLVSIDPLVTQGEHKGGRRHVALARLLILAGLNDVAAKEALKVPALMKPSPWQGWAQALAGIALTLNGQKSNLLKKSCTDPAADPMGLWNRYLESAQSISDSLSDENPSAESPSAERNLLKSDCDFISNTPPSSFGFALKEAGLHLYAVKEGMKIAAGIYNSKSDTPDSGLADEFLQLDSFSNYTLSMTEAAFPNATRVQKSRFTIARWLEMFISPAMANFQDQPLMEYFKVIYMAGKKYVDPAKDGSPGAIETAALIRAGQWLHKQGKIKLAQKYYSMASETGHADYRKSAADLLSEGGVNNE